MVDALLDVRQGLESAPTMPVGEGQERLMRTLLRDKVLLQALRWPQEKMVNGEFLDLMGFDSINYLVVYVETKTPKNQSISEREISKFERKLREQGTCEAGMITNGHRIIGYKCSTGTLGVEVTRTSELDLDELATQAASGEITVEDRNRLILVFDPLRAERYVGKSEVSYGAEHGRIRPSTDHPADVKKLSRQLKSAIDALKPALVTTLRTFLTSRIPVGAADGTGFTISEPFDDWSTYSGRVPSTTMELYLRDLVTRLVAFKDEKPITDVIIKREAKSATKKLGLHVSEDLLSELISALISAPKDFDHKLHEVLLGLIMPDHIEIFAGQTAYVMLNRLLLYRVVEDKGLVARKLSGRNLDLHLNQGGGGLLDWYMRASAFRNLIEDAQRLVEEVFYSHLYVHGLFDWWIVPKEVRDRYTKNQETIYRRILREIDVALEKCIRILNTFELSQISRDIWKDVYQEYLPPKERARLGGFYTPDPIVNLILDLVGYTAEKQLCTANLLDPACGSGTFIVEAGKRLRVHLEQEAPCHTDISTIDDERERAWRILTRVIGNLNAIDIHPFACFLTEMNFLLANVDLLLKAKQLDPGRRITELSVGCDDSLRPPEQQVQLKLSQFMETNSRANRMVRDRQRAKSIKETRFQFVVGNPPWSGVLRGELSPLFDEGAKSVYSAYDSAIDKYDIYALFLERGLDWLTPDGRLGFITQNRFLRRRYGRGIRGYIRKKASLLACLDIWRASKLVFPGRTNYPCLTIMELKRNGSAFPYLEVKATGRTLTLAELARKISETVAEIREGREVENQFLIGYPVPDEVVRQDPDRPWNLVSSSVSKVKQRLLSKKGCERLATVLEPNQGVTPGGGSLAIYLVKSLTALDPALCPPAVEAEDIVDWTLGPPSKWLVYPYRDDGQVVNLGDLEFDLDQDRAIRQVNSLIATGSIRYPKTARYLVQHYSLLASRQAEKQTWRELGKRWYEYHRPREPSTMKAHPKIITRRMSHDLQFALDVIGFVPTDGCIALALKPDTKWLQRCREQGLNNDDALAFCLALLNATTTKFLLLSSADAWQGDFYQIREDLLGQIPIPFPLDSNVRAIKNVIRRAKRFMAGEGSSFEIDRAILRLYDVKSQEALMREYLTKKTPSATS